MNLVFHISEDGSEIDDMETAYPYMVEAKVWRTIYQHSNDNG